MIRNSSPCRPHTYSHRAEIRYGTNDVSGADDFVFVLSSERLRVFFRFFFSSHTSPEARCVAGASDTDCGLRVRFQHRSEGSEGKHGGRRNQQILPSIKIPFGYPRPVFHREAYLSRLFELAARLINSDYGAKWSRALKIDGLYLRSRSHSSFRCSKFPSKVGDPLKCGSKSTRTDFSNSIAAPSRRVDIAFKIAAAAAELTTNDGGACVVLRARGMHFYPSTPKRALLNCFATSLKVSCYMCFPAHGKRSEVKHSLVSCQASVWSRRVARGTD